MLFKRKRDDKCYTYFSIRGDFDTDVVTSLLGLQPYKTWKSTDTRKDGKPHGFSCWDYGKCEEYDILTENQMLKTIADLIPKIDILKQIREKYDVDII